MVADNVTLLRPLLAWKRSDLRAWVVERGWQAVDDPSNSNPRFGRTHARTLLAETSWLDSARLASVNGKEVWNTNEEKDSSFVFVANKDRMIKGFTEVTMLLHEGDEIVAILPPELAYGERGSGSVIPPNATLIYTQYKMKKVDEAKRSLSDTLFQAYKTGGHEKHRQRD